MDEQQILVLKYDRYYPRGIGTHIFVKDIVRFYPTPLDLKYYLDYCANTDEENGWDWVKRHAHLLNEGILFVTAHSDFISIYIEPAEYCPTIIETREDNKKSINFYCYFSSLTAENFANKYGCHDKCTMHVKVITEVENRFELLDL